MRCGRLRADDNLENNAVNWPPVARLPVDRAVGTSPEFVRMTSSQLHSAIPSRDFTLFGRGSESSRAIASGRCHRGRCHSRRRNTYNAFMAFTRQFDISRPHRGV